MKKGHAKNSKNQGDGGIGGALLIGIRKTMTKLQVKMGTVWGYNGKTSVRTKRSEEDQAGLTVSSVNGHGQKGC
jgi:hypothetical protein